MWTYVIGPFLALFPSRWRKAVASRAPIDWNRATAVSGIAEFVLGLAALVMWYFHFITPAVDQQLDPLVDAAMDRGSDAPGYGAAMAVGFSGLIYFVIQPLTWLLTFLWIEGMLRALAVGYTQQAPGSAIFAAVDRAATRLRRGVHEMRVPLVPDQVARPDGKRRWDLMVLSCRRKTDWKYPMVIRYGGEFFKVLGEARKPGPPERPHIYLLRRPREGEAYRGLQDYDPENPVSTDRAFEPNFLVGLGRAFWRKMTGVSTPLVADTVAFGDGTREWNLRVESCRPKPAWTNMRTIEYQGRLYRFVSTYECAPPRPFGFELVLLPSTEVARGVIPYSVDEPLRVGGRR